MAILALRHWQEYDWVLPSTAEYRSMDSREKDARDTIPEKKNKTKQNRDIRTCSRSQGQMFRLLIAPLHLSGGSLASFKTLRSTFKFHAYWNTKNAIMLVSVSK